MPAMLLSLAFSLCLAGPVALRLGWQRNRATVALGWLALALAAILLAREGGAWGLAAGSTVAMVSAVAILARAALVTAPRRAATGRVQAPLPPEPIDWPDVRRRMGVFLVVVVLDLCASLAFSWSIQRALFRSGTNAADATALALFLLPLLWLALATWQMMQERLAMMLPAPVTLAALGGIAWLMA